MQALLFRYTGCNGFWKICTSCTAAKHCLRCDHHSKIVYLPTTAICLCRDNQPQKDCLRRDHRGRKFCVASQPLRQKAVFVPWPPREVFWASLGSSFAPQHLHRTATHQLHRAPPPYPGQHQCHGWGGGGPQVEAHPSPTAEISPEVGCGSRRHMGSLWVTFFAFFSPLGGNTPSSPF